MEAGEDPARARRRDARKALSARSRKFGDKPLGDREGDRVRKVEILSDGKFFQSTASAGQKEQELNTSKKEIVR